MSDDSKDTSAVDQEKAIASNDEPQETSKDKEEEKAAQELEDKSDSSSSTIHARVAAPFKEYFDGQAFSISATNLTGPFDILPQHHNFISLLTACDITIRHLLNGEQKVIKITISGGIIHVKENEVVVFLDV